MRWTPAEADPSSAEAARAKLVFMMSRTRSDDGQSDNENENERREEIECYGMIRQWSLVVWSRRELICRGSWKAGLALVAMTRQVLGPD
jgi:hypothetical protein